MSLDQLVKCLRSWKSSPAVGMSVPGQIFSDKRGFIAFPYGFVAFFAAAGVLPKIH